MSTIATIDNGIWSWWVRPLIVPDQWYTWVSTIARLGTNRVHRVDIDNGAVDHLKLGGRDVADDHNAGAIAYHPDRNTLLVFYARHGQDDYIRWRHVNRSTLNVSADERRLQFGGRVTYAQVLQQPGGRDGRLVLLVRVNATWQYRMTWDWGATWTNARVLVDASSIGQPYVLTAIDPSDSAHVHCALYGNPASTSHRPIHAFSIGLHSGSVRSLGGTLLGDLDSGSGLGLTPDQLEIVHDPGPDRRCRLLDITGDAAKSPRLVVAEWTGNEGDAEYRVVGPTDAPAWRLATGREIGHTRAAHYIGGAAWTPSGGLVTSRQDPPEATDGTWHVEHWTPDLATGTPVVTSPRPLCRPVTAEHPDGGTQLGLVDIRLYDGYRTYDSDVQLHHVEA